MGGGLFIFLIYFSIRQIGEEILLGITSSGIGIPQWWYTIGMPAWSVLVVIRIFSGSPAGQSKIEGKLMDSGFLLFGLFFLLLFLGVPIAVSVGITSLFLLWQFNLGVQIFSPNFYANIAKISPSGNPFLYSGRIPHGPGWSLPPLGKPITSAHRADPRGPGNCCRMRVCAFRGHLGTGPAIPRPSVRS